MYVNGTTCGNCWEVRCTGTPQQWVSRQTTYYSRRRHVRRGRACVRRAVTMHETKAYVDC
eukprot:7995687-Pyramimonas_sp.AAC.1